MTKSEELIARARRLVHECGGCEISEAVYELCREYEIAIKQALALEESIHALTKP